MGQFNVALEMINSAILFLEVRPVVTLNISVVFVNKDRCPGNWSLKGRCL